MLGILLVILVHVVQVAVFTNVVLSTFLAVILFAFVQEHVVLASVAFGVGFVVVIVVH